MKSSTAVKQGTINIRLERYREIARNNICELFINYFKNKVIMKTTKDFKRFFIIALGSAYELETQVIRLRESS